MNSLPLAIDVNGVTAVDGSISNHNGFLDPGERVLVTLPLTNYTTNPNRTDRHVM